MSSVPLQRSRRGPLLQCLGDFRLDGVKGFLFVLAAFAAASAFRWFLLGDLSVRLLFPSFLLAVIASTWVAGTRGGVLGILITLLTGITIYGGDASGLTTRDLYSLGFISLVSCVSVLLVSKARRTREEVATGRRWFSTLLDHSTEAIGFVRNNGALYYLNRSGRELWAVPDDAVGMPMDEVLPMRCNGRPFVLADDLVAPRNGELRRDLPSGLQIRRDDEWIDVTGCVTWIRESPYGRGMIFSLQWDEALVRATDQLEVTRRHLDALLEADVVGVATLDAEGRLRCANHALLQMLGIVPESRLADELSLDSILVSGMKSPTGLDRTPHDALLRRADGSTTWVSLCLAPTGPNEGLLLAIRVDDRKRAEQDSHADRTLLQAIIDQVPALIAFVRPDGKVELANRHASRLMGEPLAGAQLPQALSPQVRAQLQPCLAAAWRGEASRVMLQTDGPLEPHSGTASPSPGMRTRHLQTQVMPYRDDSGRITGAVWHAFDVSENMQRQIALGESEYRFRRLAETFSAVVWQAMEDGHLISDFGWKRFTGRAPVRWIQQWADAVHPEDVPRLLAFQQQLALTDDRLDVELRLAFHEGGYRHVLLKGIPMNDCAAHPRQWIGCIRDIHSRKEYAAALAAREAELRLILETVPVRLASLDSGNVIQRCNRMFAECFGLPPDATGIGLDRVLPAEAMQALMPALERAQHGESTSVEWSLEHPEQGLRWSHTSFTPDIDADGRVRSVITLCVDCTDRRERETALRRNVAQLQALMKNVPHMVWIADPQGRVEYFNPRWYDFTRCHQCTSWTEAVHPLDRAEAQAAFDRARLAGHEFSHEVRYRDGNDGQYRWHLVRAIPLHQEDGSILRWYGSCTDIHDQKAAEQTLREEQSRTDQFLATLSHELRNPLAALFTSAYLLDAGGDADQAQCQASATIRRQATHLKRLVDDLLDLSRITLGKVRLELQLFDLRALCADACADSGMLAEQHGVRLRFQAPDQPIRIHGDPVRLRQCMDNLVSNAIKASRRGDQVQISLRLMDAQVELAVQDQGAGIPPELLQQIFQPFAQGEQWCRHGLGLGLSIVQKMVELHGGTIEADSGGYGHGARFSIRLPHDGGIRLPCPIPQGLSASTPHLATTKPERAAAKGKVLIIDDEEDSVRALTHLLELQGHDVLGAGDGESALLLARHHRPQVVVSDLGLPPPLNGLALAARLREEADWPLYLIAYSGYGTRNDVERSLAGGFDVHLTKPCNPLALIEAISQGLRATRAVTTMH